MAPQIGTAGRAKYAHRAIDGTTLYVDSSGADSTEGRLPAGADPAELERAGYTFLDRDAFLRTRESLDPIARADAREADELAAAWDASMTPAPSQREPRAAALAQMEGMVPAPRPSAAPAPGRMAPRTHTAESPEDLAALGSAMDDLKTREGDADVDALASAYDDMRSREAPVEVAAVPRSVPMATPLGGSPLPGPSERAVEQAPGRVQRRGAEDDLAGAQRRANLMRGLAGMSRGTSRIGAAIAGTRPAQGVGEGLERSASQQVEEYLQRKQAAQAEAKSAQEASMRDPLSPASQRLQATVSRAFGSIYTPEEISQMTAADAPLIMDAGKFRSTLDARRQEREDALAARAEERTGRATEAERQRTFQAGENAKNRAAQAALARGRAPKAPAAPKPVPGSVVPDMEIVPGAAPTADDAKKVKGTLAASARMSKYVDELDQLHTTHGTEYGGKAGTRMGQLATQIQLEAKTISELGALSGPDQELMKSLAGTDPSSFWANVQAMFGVDNTQAALDGLRTWMRDAVEATSSTYGYQPSGGGRATQAPASAPTAGAAPRRRRDSQGQVWEEQPDGSARLVL